MYFCQRLGCGVFKIKPLSRAPPSRQKAFQSEWASERTERLQTQTTVKPARGTALADKGCSSPIVPARRHIDLFLCFSSNRRCALLRHAPFLFAADGSASQRPQPDEEERFRLQGCVRHQQVLHQEVKGRRGEVGTVELYAPYQEF